MDCRHDVRLFAVNASNWRRYFMCIGEGAAAKESTLGRVDVLVQDVCARQRTPTQNELDTGIFANTHDEYFKEQATVPTVA
jgi:hypothetical protein